jgi:hypothetical protein
MYWTVGDFYLVFSQFCRNGFERFPVLLQLDADDVRSAEVGLFLVQRRHFLERDALLRFPPMIEQQQIPLEGVAVLRAERVLSREAVFEL